MNKKYEGGYIPSVDPHREWYRGPLGALVRHRHIAGICTSEVAGAAISFLGGLWALGLVLLFAAVATSGVLLVMRHGRLKEMKCDAEMHNIAHSMRDNFAEFSFATGNAERRILARQVFANIVNDVAKLFRVKKSDESVNCCIRLYQSDGYETVARSSGMHPDRDRNSVSIPADCGIAKEFFQRNCLGALLIDSIEEAVKRGWWQRTPNDDYDDVTCLLATPINSNFLCDDGRLAKTMTGILLVSACRESTVSVASCRVL